jgi:hypothetical protein
MLEAMQAEGLDLDACIRILRAAGPDTAAEKRRAYDRERKAAKRAEDRLSGGKSGGNPPDPSPNERDILTPTREEKPEPKGSVKKVDRGVRLPGNWEPQPLAGKAAEMVACWQAGELERELAKFKNYWLAKGSNAARTDWQRTWVNWLISADERKPRHGNATDTNPTATALARVQAAIRSGSSYG